MLETTSNKARLAKSTIWNEATIMTTNYTGNTMQISNDSEAENENPWTLSKV